MPALYHVLVYLEITEENEFQTPVKEEEEKEEEATVLHMDEESLNGTLVSNNWSPL